MPLAHKVSPFVRDEPESNSLTQLVRRQFFNNIVTVSTSELERHPNSVQFNPNNQDAEIYLKIAMSFIASTFKFISIGGMMLGGAVVFLPQYYEIWQSGNSEGFSTHVCLILIIANLMRLCFWFAVRFETPLLLQSIFVTITMLALQEICVRTRLKKGFNNSRLKTKRFFDLDFGEFWQWTYFSDYIYFLSSFFVLIAFITNLFIQSELFIDSLGFVAVLTEALLLLPQLLRNFKRKSTIGLSVKMVLMMLGGDLFKTGYYIVRDVPNQFWICSIFQVTLDLATLFQVFHYGAAYKLVSKLSDSMTDVTTGSPTKSTYAKPGPSEPLEASVVT